MFDLIFCPLNDCWEKGCYYIYTALYDDNPAVLYMTIYAQTPENCWLDTRKIRYS